MTYAKASTPASTERHIDNAKWLRGVRSDLDSAAKDWVVATHRDAISKMNALGDYLNTILNELGYPAPPHNCPTCGDKHGGKSA